MYINFKGHNNHETKNQDSPLTINIISYMTCMAIEGETQSSYLG